MPRRSGAGPRSSSSYHWMDWSWCVLRCKDGFGPSSGGLGLAAEKVRILGGGAPPVLDEPQAVEIGVDVAERRPVKGNPGAIGLEGDHRVVGKRDTLADHVVP